MKQILIPENLINYSTILRYLRVLIKYIFTKSLYNKNAHYLFIAV